MPVLQAIAAVALPADKIAICRGNAKIETPFDTTTVIMGPSNP